ncbi:Rieske (2Fe-2S) protein [Pseudonocardia sp. TRM90224]|uniref:Rieske (2Fe-2S) protein n=1 Tax=Pseudonocardia sp. TRM90224 TaxID=2812678 RepID=UPI001E37FF6D|nr:Rieske (2Fe-2S) protein [Pseudonocardia sp. TRM90224]
MSTPSRRAVLIGACGTCAAALTACAGYGPGRSNPPAPAPAGPAPAGGAANGSGAAQIASTADIPVGGGLIFADQDLVITQPTAGTFKAFSATCTHQGCVVESVADGVIKCPCHGSVFAAADGSVTDGPAPTPLPAKQITVSGTAITLA